MPAYMQECKQIYSPGNPMQINAEKHISNETLVKLKGGGGWCCALYVDGAFEGCYPTAVWGECPQNDGFGIEWVNVSCYSCG